jgi:anti-sigma B factor antagonist
VEFTVTSAEQGPHTVVTVVGDLDVHTAPVLQQHLAPLTAVYGTSLIIDLSGVGFVDSTGLGVMVGALKSLRESGGRLSAVVTVPRVLKVFSLTGLDAVIPIRPTLDDALAAG